MYPKPHSTSRAYDVRQHPVAVEIAPTANFLTDDRMWDHLRVPRAGSPAEPVDKAQIGLYRDAVEAALDGPGGELGRSLITQTLSVTLDEFPYHRDAIRLAYPPAQSVTSITYVDSGGVAQTLDPARYRFVRRGAWQSEIAPAYGATWPATRAVPQAVTVTWRAGFGPAATDVPSDVVAAGLLMVQDLYEQRAATVAAALAENPAVERLLGKHRITGFG